MRLAVLLLAACATPTDYITPPPITSEVQDWRDEVIYQVMIDRFSNGDQNNDFNVTYDPAALARYQGGDWQGLIDQMDYLVELGVTALWISPVVGNVEEDAGVAGYHGYWTQDFVATNPHFGDLPKLRELVDVAHQHGLKVIVDIVTNHVGQLFYYDINRNGQPDSTIYGAGNQDSLDGFGLDPIEVITEWDPSYDPRGIQGWTSLGESGPSPLGWVYMPEINRVPPNPPEFANPEWYNRRGRVYDWNQRDQVMYGDFPGGLKDLNTANPEVVAALIDVFKFWITETNIDGYRIDTVKHIEHSFWQQFCSSIRQHCKDLGKERFLMFGEVFDGDDVLLGSYTFDQELDSVFYFSHKFQVFDDVFKNGQPTKKIEQLYQQRLVNYESSVHTDGIGLPPQQALVNFIDNHDIPRFLWNIDDERRLGAALTYLLTMDGIPCIYYGTEQGFNGGNDPANRENLWLSGFNRQAPFFQQISALSKVRRTYEPMRRGGFSVKWASERGAGEEDGGIIAFERPLDGRSVLVVVNSGAAAAHTSYQGNDMPVTFAPGTVLEAVYPAASGITYTVSAGGTVRVELGAFEGVVLVPQSDVLPLVQ